MMDEATKAAAKTLRCAILANLGDRSGVLNLDVDRDVLAEIYDEMDTAIGAALLAASRPAHEGGPMNANALREMLGKATPTPWVGKRGSAPIGDTSDYSDYWYINTTVPCKNRQVACLDYCADEGDENDANQDLIVAAVNLFAALLDVLEAAEKAQYGVVERCGRGEETGFYRVGESDMKAMRDNIAALYRRAGEVMDGK